MGDREFANALRTRAIKLLEEAVRPLRPHPENKTGEFAPHVACAEVMKLRRLARKLEALADVAEGLKP